MNSRLIRYLFLGALACATAPACAQELGRLFLTPEERAALDARRRAQIPDVQAPPAAPPAAHVPTTRVDGFVSRSDGKSTLWINGEAIPEGRESGGLRPLPGRSEPGSVTIVEEESARRFDLKVGESFDRNEGSVRDVIGGGRITVRPGRAAPR